MNIRSLGIISKLRGKSQSELAQMVGVSRAAVSQWFRSTKIEVPILSTHLLRLADGLGVSADDLLKPFPFIENTEETKRLTTRYLWDRLYPSLTDFGLALLQNDPTALARMTEVDGLFRTSKTIGRAVWDRFPSYKNRIRPARRKQLESLWQLHHQLN